jgi:alpha-beta hydrolase superfamily lysophospholipase
LGDAPRNYTVEEYRASDGFVGKLRRYPAVGTPKGEVVFLHGIQSHAGWYEYSCTYLAQQGFTVSFVDRRGSGMNETARGDCPNFRRLVDDVAEFVTSIPRAVSREKTVVRVPVFLASISWGGKLAVALERRHPALVDGLVLLAPGFFPKIHPPLGTGLRIFFNRWIRPRKLFPIPLNDPELFTTTPRWIEFLKHDPLRLHQATARMMLESARLDAYLRFAPKYVHVPVLLMLAGEDRIIHNARTRDFVERFATPDKEFHDYPGTQHTLEFEPDPHVFLGDLVRWLERHAAAKATPPA